MKIGILTFHNAHNYGAVLQAYALRTVLRKMGHDAVILNYHNTTIDKHYPKELNTDDDQKQKDWHKQYQRFEEFINRVLLEGYTHTLTIEDLECTDIDCFVCGSDQIWETSLTGGIDPVYFLDFQTKAKKISYAASKAFASISEGEKMYFKQKLSKFSGISVRERTVVEELKACGILAVNVLDPALLLEAKDYEALLDSENTGHEKYILAYFHIEDDALQQCVKKASDKTGLMVKEIHFYRVANTTHDKRADCGPKEFIELFKNAEYVFTNSFHGLIFSIIFGKSFYGVYKKDNRKDELLKKLNLENRHITDANELVLNKIDLTNALEAVKKEKNISMTFLNDVL